MNSLISRLPSIKHALIVVSFSLLGGLTIISTGLAGAKVAEKAKNYKSINSQQQQTNQANDESKPEDTEEVLNPIATPKSVSGGQNVPLQKSLSGSSPTPKPSVLNNVSSPTSTFQPASSTGCIITLFGKQYDVTSLQSTHSGGNVFNCGTDMTTVYQSRHGSNVSQMAPYLVTQNGGTSSPPSSSPTTSPQLPRGGGGDGESEND